MSNMIRVEFFGPIAQNRIKQKITDLSCFSQKKPAVKKFGSGGMSS